MGSLLRSLLSPALNWVSAENRQKYGAVLNSFLLGILANEESTKRSTHDDTSLNVEEVQKIIGYSFNDRNLLSQAFTHPSYHKDCVSYQRLEYVGDSVLNLMITKQQFSMYPDLPPGLLSPLRAANVDTEKLARVAVKHSFHKYLRHGRPILTRRVTNTLLEPIITPEMLRTNPVKKLYETCQKHKLKVRVVDLWSHDGSFEVYIENQLSGKGMCHAKKEVALNRAANKAYDEVMRILNVGSLKIANG